MYARIAISVLLMAAPVLGQRLHFGIKAGVPITEYFETGRSASLHGSAEYSAATRRYTVGATAELRLTDAIGFEIDVLYHRMGYVAIVESFDSGNGNFHKSEIDVKGNSWDFPLMAKYRFGRVTRPYVMGGGVIRYIGPVRGRGQETNGSLAPRTSSTTRLDTSEPSELRKRFYLGLTVAAGVELGAKRFRLLPEFHFTRWTANIARAGGLLRFPSNQAEFLVGLCF
jgi:Outer membrane protein beta-barrel domain